MRNTIYKLLSVLVLMMTIWSCKEDELITLSDDPAEFVIPAFTNDATGAFVMLFAEEADTFELFEWTAADYGIVLPVTYKLQMSTDVDFTESVNLASEVRGLKSAATIKQVNDACILLGVGVEEEVTVYFRLVGAVSGTDVPSVYSTTISRDVTTYNAKFDPIYMVGAGVGGWNFDLAVETYGIAPGEFEVIARFISEGDANWRFLSNLDWSGAGDYNYPYFTTVDPLFVNDGDNNFKFIGTTGYYRINANLNTKTVSMEALEDRPHLYIIGDGTSVGWDFGSSIDMTWVKDGVFQATTTFYNDGNKQWRFLAVLSWSGTDSRNYEYFSNLGFEIDPILTNAGGNDKNFFFTGTDATTQTITVNELEKTITLSAPPN